MAAADAAMRISLDKPSRRAAFLDRVAVSIHVAIWYAGFVFPALAPIFAYFLPIVRVPLLVYLAYIWGPGSQAGFNANDPGAFYRLPLWDRCVGAFRMPRPNVAHRAQSRRTRSAAKRAADDLEV